MTDVLADDLFFVELIEGLSEAVLVAEPGKPHYVYVNTATEALLGYTRAELLALGPRDVSTPESFSHLRGLAEVLDRDGWWQGTWQLRRKDGQTVEVLATASRQVHRGRVFYQGLARPLAERVTVQPDPSVERQPGLRQRRSLVHCASCGREVTGTTRRRYCSEKCRQWAYYHRNVEAQRARSRGRQRRRTDVEP